jgi:streptogramin lyase
MILGVDRWQFDARRVGVSFARRALAATAACVLLAACGGSAGSTGAAPSAQHGSSTLQGVSIRVTVPAAIARTAATKRTPKFVSPATNGVLVNVYAATDTNHQSVLGSSATDVSSGSAACGGTTGTPRTCTIPIPAPPGSDSFVFTSYDAPPSGGSFSGAKALGAGLVTQTIGQGQSNVVNVTLGGIVSAVSLSLATPFIHGTVASQQRLTVAALDADGNVIVTDGYVDANGNPVTLFIGAAPNPSSEIILNATTLTAPAPAGVTVTYNGTATAAYASTITATASTGPTATTALTLIGPKETVFATPTVNSFPFTITSGPDGNLWFTEAGVGKVGRITPGGTIAEFTAPAGPALLQGITSGPDGNLWVADANNGLIKLTPAGSFSGGFGIAGVVLVAAGADGALWATEEGGNAIGRWTTAGAHTNNFPMPQGASSPLGIAGGPDGNLWIAESSGNRIARLTTGGTFTEFTLPQLNSGPAFITAGSDGNLWFTENASRVGRITTSGTIAEFAIGGPAAGITNGPDGNVWVTEQTLPPKIARITPAGTVAEYTVAAGALNKITTGADGNLWYTEYSGAGGTSTVRRFVW